MAVPVSGRVLDEAGNAIEHARVMFANAPVSVPDIAALTDERGRFTLSAPVPGRYTLSIAADGFATSSTDVTLDVAPGDLTVRLHRA